MGCIPPLRAISKLQLPSFRRLGYTLASLLARATSGSGSKGGTLSKQSMPRDGYEDLELGAQKPSNDSEELFGSRDALHIDNSKSTVQDDTYTDPCDASPRAYLESYEVKHAHNIG